MTTKTLGEVATYINGRAFKPTEWEDKGLPIVRIQNLTDQNAKYNHSSLALEEKYRVKNGDLLFAWSASLGAHIWRGNDAWLNQHIFKVIPSECVDKLYLYYFLCFVVSDLYSKTHGSGMVHITKGPFLSTRIAVPSLQEQERIVARIEELFSQLDAGVETLKKTKAQLTVYRQAVLKEAYKNVKCFEKKTFGDLLCQMRNGYGIKPSDTGENKILKISAVRPMKINFEERRYNDLELPAEDTIQTNDLLFTRYNGSIEYVGVCARVPHLNDTYAVPDKIIRCVLKDTSDTHSKYLQYYMNHREARQYILSKVKTTSGQKGIAGSDIKKVLVFVPPYDVQAQIVSEVETKLSGCDSIEKTIDTALQQADAMRQSILKKAFEGKL